MLRFGPTICILICLIHLFVSQLFVTHHCYAAEQGVPLDIKWMGTDLIDEMVHELGLHPPFIVPTAVVLVDVDAPIGLDDRFRVVVENHLIDLLMTQPATHLQLAYCAVCRRMVVKSDRNGTYIGRGIDQPEVIGELSAKGAAAYGLALNYEVESNALVLRAQIFRIHDPGQPIVWSHSFSTNTSSRLALQRGDHLMSLAEAQDQQDKIIHKQDLLEWVSRVTMTMYSVSDSSGNGGASTMSPLLFAEQSLEGVLLPKKSQRMALTVGATSIDSSMQGYRVGGHFGQLLFRDEPSLSKPDLYLILGFQYTRIRGPGAVPFGDGQFDLLKILNSASEPRAAFVAYRLGIELHAKHRLGALVFLEKSPIFDKSKFIASKSFLGLPYHGFGIGVLVKW